MGKPNGRLFAVTPAAFLTGYGMIGLGKGCRRSCPTLPFEANQAVISMIACDLASAHEQLSLVTRTAKAPWANQTSKRRPFSLRPTQMDPETQLIFEVQLKGTYVRSPGGMGGGLDRFPFGSGLIASAAQISHVLASSQAR